MSNARMSDIAKAAGVSLATVGRVIHNNGYVSAETREEIERVISRLGYIPNKMAQGLKSSRSKIIGHLTLFNTNMLFEQISASVNMAASKEGYHVLTLTSHMEKADEEQQINDLIGHRVEGMLITSNLWLPKELIVKVTELQIPVVMIERGYNLPLVDRVLVNDLAGAFNAVSHITGRGHRRVGFIGKQLAHEVEADRYRGYCDAIAHAGIGRDEGLIRLMPEYSVQFGYEAMKSLLAEPNPPTAVFMTADTFACGAMQYLYERGIRVPDAVSLVGYDNTLSTLLAPPVTSVGLPPQEIGEQAFRLLLERMENRERPAQTVRVDTLLIDRGTVKDLMK